MPSYRFCRPDDLALIIKAINACYLMHYPEAPAMTEERLKEHMTLFQVRPGNCMVALERQQPVGVVVSTKRDYGVWIQALGCQPAFQRRGIATQLIEALVRKIAIQRAPRVTVDVPTANTPARFMSSASAARGERSRMRPRVNGPRSLILTTTERPLSRFVTFAKEDSGSERCAAISFR